MSVQRVWASLTMGVGLLALAVYAGVVLATPPEHGLNAFFTRWVYEGVVFLAVVIAGSRAVALPRDRAAWTVITISLACWAFAETYYEATEPEAYPSVADYGWIAFYPVVYIGIVLLIRRRARSITGALWLDGVIASLAAAALGAAVLVEVVLRTTEGSLSTVATNLSYPLGDVLLLSAVFGVFSLAGWRPGRRWLVLGLGVLATTIADGVYLFQAPAGTYEEGTVIDLLWPASMILIAAAAWVDEHDERGLRVEGRPLLAVPATCAVLSIGILVYDHFAQVNLLALALAGATLLLVVVRLVATFHENSRLFELTKHEATTDALTGLGNRRKLLADLGHRLEHNDPAPMLLLMFDLNGFKAYNDSFGHTAGDALLTRLGRKLTAAVAPEGATYRLGGDEFCVITPVDEGNAEQLMNRASAALSEQGEGFEIGSSFGGVLLPYEATEPSEALRLADERLYSQKRSQQGIRTMSALVEALSERGPHGRFRSDAVQALAVVIGRMLGLHGDELDALARAAELHDLGELAIPEKILNKPGPLDEREWEFIRRHTVVGERILRASPSLRGVGSIVRATHENWDGTGYPDGLAGEEIPLAARIIGACHAFDAMTSPRPYHPARTPEEALVELESRAGTNFDPAVVRVLSALVRARLEAEQAA